MRECMFIRFKEQKGLATENGERETDTVEYVG